MSKTVKIIHVHFINGHRNYYFGSVRAIYKMFSPEELGCSETYLRHQLTERGNGKFSIEVQKFEGFQAL